MSSLELERYEELVEEYANEATRKAFPNDVFGDNSPFTPEQSNTWYNIMDGILNMYGNHTRAAIELGLTT